MEIAFPYITLLLFFFFCGLYLDHVKSEKDKLLLNLVVVLVFFGFFGFRGFIAGDWTNYYPFFQHCKYSDILHFNLLQGSFEPGFTFLCALCKSIYNNWFFFQFVVSLIDTILLVRFLNHASVNIPYALMLYITFNGFTMSTDLMRNSIAIMIFINALDFIQQRKIIPYMICCLIALMFHTSAFFFFPLYFFFHIRLNRWIYLILFIIANIVFLLHIPIVPTILSIIGTGGDMQNKIKAYTEVMTESKVLSIGYLERLFSGLMLFIYYDKLLEIRRGNALYFNGLATYILLSFFLSQFQILSERITYLFSYGYWVVWLDFAKCFKYDNNRRLYKTFMVAYCIIRMFNSVKTSSDFKYDNILFDSKSYQERLYIKNTTGGLKKN